MTPRHAPTPERILRTYVTLTLLATLASSFIQAFLNELIPSAQRATVLSSDNMLASLGGVVAQPALGRVADAWGFPASYLVAAAIELLAWPFLLLARRERAPSDPLPPAARGRPAGAAPGVGASARDAPR